jgi:prepilin-type N-terminal cleavage/methylation domain-containing protein
MTQRQNTNRRAFTMTEVLISLSLLTIFFAAAGEVFRSTVLLSSDIPSALDHSTQIDSALFQFRRDVWNSPQITVPSKTSVDLESANGKISWTIDPAGNLIRTDSEAKSEQWKSIAKNWSFQTDGSCLTITDGSAEVRLPSQILLSRGAHP